MAYQRNMSGWLAALRDEGLSKGRLPLLEDRIGDVRRLMESGLPTYEHSIMPLSRYLSSSAVERLYGKHRNRMVCRVVPLTDSLQRMTLIDTPLEEARRSLSLAIGPRLRRSFMVILNEYDPASYVGILISAEERLLVEVEAAPNLESLAHGQAIPWSAVFECGRFFRVRHMRYYGFVPVEVRKVMWRAVRLVSEQREGSVGLPNFVPRQGYFEFVLSEQTGALRFIDYKKEPLPMLLS